ncbi:type I-F CRISPR-associated protein Csy2 [Shewanella sp. AS1]|uniref:type I-F CRISPR-associated protein Csy2 n=1 Tax=Shewanella sp. AS1 TaxID=2907626 RepID=UPI001F173830|nr:type I-F CRISPR-associated protein Csy2 [Shewanella sp. AS1]MCE9680470.1 type I-F CRISPR-associated protein Csy2 [Shewanella sp. AS1]
MSCYLLIERLSVQNANAIAGLTYGFPAITNFLGFAHALSRKLDAKLNVSLGGVVVVSHTNTVHVRQPKGWGDYVFALTRNPLTQQGNTAPINEEGRMNMQVSLLIELEGFSAGDVYLESDLLAALQQSIPTSRLAGGQITNYRDVRILATEEQQVKALRTLMPGFVLTDRSDYLTEHYAALSSQDENASLFDAWCDFAKLKFQAPQRNESNSDDTTPDNSGNGKWHYVPKPYPGYLVPIAAGYCAISLLYEAGVVENVRDKSVPVAFAETAYSVGEWRSVHALRDISDGVWRYEHSYPWYLAKNKPFIVDIPELDADDEETLLEDN